MIGRTLGDYRIVDKLGAGGMGEVYRAHDAKLERDVALKVLPGDRFADDTARARLLREARAAARLNHPHICTVYEVGEADGQAFIAMELVEGEPLSARLARGPLPAEQTARYALQLADALAHAHERGVVHRDFKSANVVVTPDGRAKVLDFGLARQVRDGQIDEATKSQVSLTAAGAVMGTLAYMAPEQLRGEPADARSDIWALGVVAHEMASGARPFHGKTGFELSSAILSESPRAVPAHVPLALRVVIERCLEKEPGRRYQRAGEVRAAVEAQQTGAAAPWGSWPYLGRRAWMGLVAAVAVVAALLTALDVGGLRTRLTGAAGAPTIESLAVLPLENLSGDPGQDYFAVGMTETLITDLTRLGALRRVTARGSVMRYQGSSRPFAEIARELKVDALVTGSVMRAGGLVSVAVQLIDPLTEDQLWANRYERDLKDVIRLQNDIVAAIVGELRGQLTPGEQARLASASTVNPNAYDAYLRGRIEANRLSPQSLDRAMGYFQVALREDSGFALAHAGIARVWSIRGHLGYVRPRDAVPEAHAAVSKALALDGELVEAYRVLGGSQFYLEWNWEAALRSWQRAVELDPNDAELGPGRAAFSAAMGQTEGTATPFERALESDPYNPQLRDFYGHQLVRLRRYDEAIVQFQQVLSSESEFSSSLNGLWRAYHLKQMYPEAAAHAARYLASRGHPDVADALNRDYASQGYVAAMRNAAAAMAVRSGTSEGVARLYAFAGERSLALDWLGRAYQDGDSTMVYLKVDPTFDVLRDDPRFQALLGKMNFPL